MIHTNILVLWSSQRRQIRNIYFSVQEACSLPPDWSESYDFVYAVDVFHDMPRPDLAMSEIFRVLRPRGMLLFNDIAGHSNILANRDIPNTEMLYAISLMYSMPVSLASEGGLGVGALWGQELATSMLRIAGFKRPQILDKAAINYMCIKE